MTLTNNKLETNKESILTAIKNDWVFIEKVFHKLRDDKEVVLAAVEQDWLALKYASDRLKDDLDVVGRAVSLGGVAYLYASDRLKKNLDIITLAVIDTPEVIHMVDHALRGYVSDSVLDKVVLGVMQNPKFADHEVAKLYPYLNNHRS